LGGNLGKRGKWAAVYKWKQKGKAKLGGDEVGEFPMKKGKSSGASDVSHRGGKRGREREMYVISLRQGMQSTTPRRGGRGRRRGKVLFKNCRKKVGGMVGRGKGAEIVFNPKKPRGDAADGSSAGRKREKE